MEIRYFGNEFWVSFTGKIYEWNNFFFPISIAGTLTRSAVTKFTGNNTEVKKNREVNKFWLFHVFDV